MTSLLNLGAGGELPFYDETIDQSLRFEDGDTARLSKTFGSGGNRKTWTWSAWIKRGNIGINGTLFHTFGVTGFGVEGFIAFSSNDTLQFFNHDGSSSYYRLITNRVFRDTSNWFHLCVVSDVENSTQSERYRMYVNGVRETSFSTESQPPNTTFQGQINTTYSHYIGGRTNNTTMFDGYLAEVNFLDGVAVTDTSGVLDELVQIKNNVCIPKEISGLSYGTTGFRLTFADSSSLGDDTSGLSTPNDFATGGLASTDVCTDSPSNNFATFNNLYVDFDSTPTYSEGNLRMDATSTSWFNSVSTFSVSSGKWYAEFCPNSTTAMFVNIMEADQIPTVFPANQSFGYSYYYDGQKWNNGSGSAYGDSWTDGDVIGVALDMDNGDVYFYKNGVVQNSGTPAFTGLSGDFVIGVSTSGTSGEFRANFGSDATFQGDKTSGSDDASDSSGQGTFYETPPSSYLALCSSNLSDTTLSPNKAENATDYFSTVLYTGNATDDRQVTGVGFKPDWGWFKERDDTINHLLFDSSRGASQQLIANTNGSESTQANKQKTFTNDGYTLGTDGQINGLNDSYLVYNWRSNGGTTSSNTDGTITSTVQANTKAGFSIVTYTGTGANGTIGHGLGVAPKLIFVKVRSTTGSWVVYHSELGATKYLVLNSTNLEASASTVWQDTEPTTSVVSIGVSSGVNTSGATYVAYCFAEVSGFSRMGRYTGNGNTSANGTYVFLGFRPQWLMIKRTDGGGTSGWLIWNNKVSTFNPTDDYLIANDTTVEQTGSNTQRVDFLSNGFRAVNTATSNTINGSGNTYVYIAFSDGQNFKFGNSR